MMAHSQKDILLLRIKRAQDALGHSLEHIHYGKGGMEEIKCKLCGAVMSGLVEHDRKQRTQMIDGKKVITRYMTHARYMSYREIEITMDCGDKHVTHVCVNCLAKGLSEEQLEFLYAGDLAQWLHEYRTRGGVPLWEVHPHILTNKPVSYRPLEVI